MKAALEFLLLEGLTDDFVELRLLAYQVAELMGVTDSMRARDAEVEDRVRRETMDVVREALLDGLAVVVSFDERSGALSPWETTPERSISTMDSEWRNLGRPLSLYEVACLRLTDAGRGWGLALGQAAKRSLD